MNIGKIQSGEKITLAEVNALFAPIYAIDGVQMPDGAEDVQYVVIREFDPSDGQPRTYLVADRNIAVNVSWDALDKLGFAKGVEAEANGLRVKVRMISSEEWDAWIMNEHGCDGLPTATPEDIDSAEHESAHNNFWNWKGLYSWTNASDWHSTRVVRGYYTSSLFAYIGAALTSVPVGFRPVLEVRNTARGITGFTSN